MVMNTVPHLLLLAALADLGENETVAVGFQYRVWKRLTEAYDEWRESEFADVQSPGACSARIGDLESGVTYECRAMARHRTAAVYGDSVRFMTA